MKVLKDIMTLGVQLTASTPDKYKQDLIHPSIKYIPQKIGGYDWAMGASPYPLINGKHDPALENPILYLGNSRAGGLPPLEWDMIKVIEETPSNTPTGYNSDPNLYHDGTRLWYFWRENHSTDALVNDVNRAIFGVYTTDGITFSNKKFFGGTKSLTYDMVTCPIITNMTGNIRMFATHDNERKLNRGLSVWDIANNDLLGNQFTLTKTVGQLYYKDFDFWHFDLFRYKNKYYCVVSPEYGNKILLGVSDDGEYYKFWDTPLLSTDTCGAVYMYKPCAMVLNEIFYLWHPVRIDGIHKIHMSEMNFEELLANIDNTTSRIL